MFDIASVSCTCLLHQTNTNFKLSIFDSVKNMTVNTFSRIFFRTLFQVLSLSWVYGNHVFLTMLYLCYFNEGAVCKSCTYCLLTTKANKLYKCYCSTHCPVSILHKSIAGRCRPVSYPDGPITARYRFM